MNCMLWFLFWEELHTKFMKRLVVSLHQPPYNDKQPFDEKCFAIKKVVFEGKLQFLPILPGSSKVENNNETNHLPFLFFQRQAVILYPCWGHHQFERTIWLHHVQEEQYPGFLRWWKWGQKRTMLIVEKSVQSAPIFYFAISLQKKDGFQVSRHQSIYMFLTQ